MPTQTQNLLDPEFLAKLGQLLLVARGGVIGGGRGGAGGGAEEQAEGDERRVRGLPKLCRRRRSAADRLEHLRPTRPVVSEALPRRGRPALFRPGGYQQLDGFRRADETALRQAGGGRAGVYCP